MLRAHGHTAPETYPLGMMSDEVNLVIERVNGLLITEASLIRDAVSGMVSKKNSKAFGDSVKRLNVETVPRGSNPSDT